MSSFSDLEIARMIAEEEGRGPSVERPDASGLHLTDDPDTARARWRRWYAENGPTRRARNRAAYAENAEAERQRTRVRMARKRAAARVAEFYPS